MPRTFLRHTLPRWLASHWREVLGWSQVLGGLAAAVVIVLEWRDAPRSGFPPWHLPAALAFCALSTVAGGLWLRGHPLGRRLSLAVQAAQVVRVTAGGVSVRALAGLVATVWYGQPGGWDAILGATATFRLGPAPAGHLEVGVNFLALAALWALARLPTAPHEAAAEPASEPAGMAP